MDSTQMVVVAIVVLAVLAFVGWPVLSRKRAHGAAVRAHALDPEHIEARIAAYRAALRRETVCQHCLFANVEVARFCAECGSRLPAARASS